MRNELLQVTPTDDFEVVLVYAPPPKIRASACSSP